jgi:hypothetical protein
MDGSHIRRNAKGVCDDGFLTLWRKSLYNNCLYYNKLAIFSEVSQVP